MKHWVYAARLRTLPLASASVILGGALAATTHQFRIQVFFLALTTTLLLQILANLANDYGDALSGADNEQRIGPERAVQSGMITREKMLIGIVVTIGLCSLSGVMLLLVSTWGSWKIMAAFAALGLSAICAAVKYTVGRKPYGYHGFGDLFVFLFFGLAGVYGTYFLITLSVDQSVLIPASALGLLSVGVLNLNNMRDHKQDILSGKNTLASRMGFTNAKIYHTILLVSAVLLFEIYSQLNQISWDGKWYWIAAIPFALHLYKVNNVKDPEKLDPQLKKLSLSTLLFTLVYSMCIILSA